MAPMKTIAIMSVLVLAPMLAGCAGDTIIGEEFNPYFQRTDKVSLGAGNASVANEAIETINPWPRYVYNTHIPGSGPVAVKAINAYEAGPSGDKASASPEVVINNAAAPASPSQ